MFLLLQALTAECKYTRCYAVFISNPSRTCILFEQTAGLNRGAQGNHVVWDYHVVAVTVEGNVGADGSPRRVLVHDRDSTLGSPIALEGEQGRRGL